MDDPCPTPASPSAADEVVKLRADNERLRRYLQVARGQLAVSSAALAHAELALARALDPGE